MQALIRELEGMGLTVVRQAPLSAHTTLGIGGPAAALVEVPRVALLPAILQSAHDLAIPVIVLGGGANSLFPDEGFDGLVIRLFKGEGTTRIEDGKLVADADVLLSRLVKTAVQAGMPGMEGLSGIPGTVGGAIVNNAGAYHQTTSDLLHSVTIAAPGGRLITLNKQELLFGYRTSTFRRERLPIVRAAFDFNPSEDPQVLTQSMRHIQKVRRGKFEGIHKNAGSTFMNPPGTFAAKLIEEAGLKGLCEGNVRMSEKHANVMENMGGGTAAQALALLEKVEAVVMDRTGIALHRELEIHGAGTAGALRDVTA